MNPFESLSVDELMFGEIVARTVWPGKIHEPNLRCMSTILFNVDNPTSILFASPAARMAQNKPIEVHWGWSICYLDQPNILLIGVKHE